MARKERRDVGGPEGGLTHNPFAALRPARPDAPPAADASSDSSEAGDASPGREPRRGRVVVRREAKGRGGKTVTRVAGLGLDAGGLAELARDLKRSLGCGATVEGDDLLLQGAQTARAAERLRDAGWSDVVAGN